MNTKYQIKIALLDSQNRCTLERHKVVQEMKQWPPSSLAWALCGLRFEMLGLKWVMLQATIRLCEPNK